MTSDDLGWPLITSHGSSLMVSLIRSDFLEMGLVKVAFLWELLAVGFSVLISDLDVVWLNGHWQRWMTHSDPTHPAVPEAALIAAADVLVTTDGLDVRLIAS